MSEFEFSVRRVSRGAMRITVHQPAESGSVFASDSWEHNIGKTVPFNFGALSTAGTLVAAVVADDGTSVALTLDVPSIESVELLSLGNE